METLAKAAAIVALPAAAWYVLLAPSKPKKKAHRGRKANKKKKEVVAAPPAPAPAAPAPAPVPVPAADPDPVRVPKAAPPPRAKPKPRRPLATTSAPAAFADGDKVEARFGGCDDYFPATITGSKPLGGGKYSYSLAYDDGATETGVSASFIQRVGGAKTPATQQSAPKPTAPAPELDGLVAYSKGGAPVPAAAPRTSHAASLAAKPRPRATNDDDDEDAFDPVQSVDDWKKAAPKPRRPAVARPDFAARKAQQAEKNDAARRAEINRKKKEKKKAKKLEVREHFRQAL